eukprot:Colp12_sorted_trinity150504_noHs@22020
MTNNYALSSNGAVVCLATASDERFPAENMIDGNEKTFWVTTGLFPHEVIITFGSTIKLSKVKIWCSQVASIALHRCAAVQPTTFEPLSEKALEVKNERLQTETFEFGSVPTRHLKIEIKSGHSEFISINRVDAEGSLMPEGSRDLVV